MKLDTTSWLGWDELPNIKEGRCSDEFLGIMYAMLKSTKPKTILEIGFNGGHSACCFLNASPDAKLYTFDICRWGIEEKAEVVLKKHFDITLIKGDSAITVPNFLEENKLLFDLILIDGCHDYGIALLDIKNTMSFLNADGIMVIDDLHMGGVYQAMIDSGLNALYDLKIVNLEIEVKDIPKYFYKSQICNKDFVKIESRVPHKITRPVAIFKNGKL